MLKEGFHQSFRELFNLMEKQKEEIASLGPDSGLSDQPLLEDEPEKLDQLKYHLTTAEAAKRRGKKCKHFFVPIRPPVKATSFLDGIESQMKLLPVIKYNCVRHHTTQ